MAQLKSKREQKKQERDDRVQAMHRAHPDIADVDARMQAHALSCVRKSLSGETTGLDAADTEYQALLAERRKLLAQYGLSEKIYEPQWDCPICEDRGYVRPGVPCVCQSDSRREASFLASGLPEKYRDKTFANFRTEPPK